MTTQTYGVTLESSALAFSLDGIIPDKWIQETAGAVWNGIKAGVSSAINLAKNMYEGGKELLGAIARGDWGLFAQWFRDDPGSALAGGAAVAVAGWFIGSASGITAAITGGIGSMWATLGGIKIGGVTLGLMLPTLQQVIVGASSTVMNLDWAKSDKAILAELNGAYLGFLNNVGESTGRMLVGFALGGNKHKPRLTLNISAAAALSISKEIDNDNDLEDELIESMAEMANIFIRYATNLAGKLGYLQLRKWARSNIKTGVKAIDDKIKNWGLIEGQSFVISSKIDEKIEKITEENPELGNFLEGLKDGVSDAFSDMILMT